MAPSAELEEQAFFPPAQGARSHREPGTEPNWAGTWAPGGLSNTVGEWQELTVGCGPPDTPLIQNPAKHIPSKGVRPTKVLGNQFSAHNFIKRRLYRDCLKKREDATFKIFS